MFSRGVNSFSLASWCFPPYFCQRKQWHCYVNECAKNKMTKLIFIKNCFMHQNILHFILQVLVQWSNCLKTTHHSESGNHYLTEHWPVRAVVLFNYLPSNLPIQVQVSQNIRKLMNYCWSVVHCKYRCTSSTLFTDRSVTGKILVIYI